MKMNKVDTYVCDSWLLNVSAWKVIYEKRLYYQAIQVLEVCKNNTELFYINRWHATLVQESSTKRKAALDQII